MPRQGEWEERPWEKRESGRDPERWRHAQREEDPWRERGEQGTRGGEDWQYGYGERGRWQEPRRGESRQAGRSEDYDRDRWLGGSREPRWGERGEHEREWERGYGEHEPWRRYGARESERGYGEREPWRYGAREWEAARHDQPSRDRPWLPPSPARREGYDTRGLVEWEDRGPLAWLREKGRELRGRSTRGPKGYTRSDERIHDEVCERIARSGAAADEVEVKVENREVTLTGTVPSREEKWWLESLADQVFGVEEVHNRLRITRESALRSSTDTGEEKTHLPH